MEIRQDGDHYLQLSPRFSEDGRMPAVYVRVDLASNGFSGVLEQTAFERIELSRFITDLDLLEHDRHGTAALSAMSPHEFEMKIEIIDRPGHVLLTAELMRYVYELGSNLMPH